MSDRPIVDDDAIHILDPEFEEEVTLCGQRATVATNIAALDVLLADQWGACWTCLDVGNRMAKALEAKFHG